MKKNFNEYARRDNKGFESEIKRLIDAMFAEVNGTNLRKGFYKKKDLFQNLQMAEPEAAAEKIFDSFGEELVAHTSKNTMNDLILDNNKKADDSALGKRPRNDDGQDKDG